MTARKSNFYYTFFFLAQSLSQERGARVRPKSPVLRGVLYSRAQTVYRSEWDDLSSRKGEAGRVRACACVCIWPCETPVLDGKTHQHHHKSEASLFFKVKCNARASRRIQCRSPAFLVAAKLAGPLPGKQEGTFSPKWNIRRPKWVRQGHISPLGLAEPQVREVTLGPAPAEIQDAPVAVLAATTAPDHLWAVQILPSGLRVRGPCGGWSGHRTQLCGSSG